mmetsp:Transcript_48770/g.71495  ORF Transcript_48770/g.71495 Transcript_48770/m.71495 type:complete len:206 (+) Transcript_48770:3-620(+)
MRAAVRVYGHVVQRTVQIASRNLAQSPTTAALRKTHTGGASQFARKVHLLQEQRKYFSSGSSTREFKPSTSTTPAGNFRYPVGTPVFCYVGTLTWTKGNVVKHNYEEPKGKFHPYQVRLQGGRLIFAPNDDEMSIRRFEHDPLTLEEHQLLENIGKCADDEDRMGVAEKYESAAKIARAMKEIWPELSFEIYDVYRNFDLEIDLA